MNVIPPLAPEYSRAWFTTGHPPYVEKKYTGRNDIESNSKSRKEMNRVLTGSSTGSSLYFDTEGGPKSV
jgi:hypothetical protein